MPEENTRQDIDISPNESASTSSHDMNTPLESSSKSKNVQFSEFSPSVFYRYPQKMESAIESTDEEDDSINASFDESAEIRSLRNSLQQYNLRAENNSQGKGDAQFPVFNKRPLSDTPVVSGYSSPSDLSPIVLSDDELSEGEAAEDKEGTGSSKKRGKKQELELRKETAENTMRNKSISAPSAKSGPEKTETPLERQYSSSFNFPGQTRTKSSPHGEFESTNEKLVVVLVGLPARGKSYLSKKLVRYLNWLQIPSKIFNVGSTRRARSKKVGPASNPLPDGENLPKQEAVSTTQDANFFSPSNEKNVHLREVWAKETLDHLLDYLLKKGGCVGVFDATNTTVKRRKMLFDTIKERGKGKLKVLYLESICNDKVIIDTNIHLKLDGPDYKKMDRNKALEDFRGRLKNYEKVYETISKEEDQNKDFQYIQMIDVGRKVIACNIKGFIPSQIIYYFLNFNLSKRLTFIARHGESTDNVKGRIGGDAPLTERGRRFSQALVKFVDFKRKEFRMKQLRQYQKELHDEHYKYLLDAGEMKPPVEPDFQVLSSMLKRSVQTSEYFPESRYQIKQLRALDELGSGNFDGMTYQEIQDVYPEEFAARLNDKMTYRYPGMGGESYLDVINRLKPIINEMERSTSHMLLITHRVVSRILLAYFLNLKREAVGELDVPLHAVYVFEPRPFGVEWKLYEYDEKQDWFHEVDPSKMENSRKVCEVGITYHERRYSVVPTAPRSTSSVSSTGSNSSVGSVRNALRDYGLRHGITHSARLPPNSALKDLQRARGM